MPPFKSLNRFLTRKRPSGPNNTLPLPAEIVDEITSYLDFLDIWRTRGVNRAFNVSCIHQLAQRFAPAITLSIQWQDKDHYPPVPGYPVGGTLLPNGVLSWTFDLESELSVLWGETKIHLTFNESGATLVAGTRPRKTWIRPSSRWAGDVVLPIAEGTDVKAMWFDPGDGRLAYGFMKKPLTSAKYVLLPDAKLQVLISLADIVRCMEHSYKFKSSRDFVPLEFTFSFNGLEKGGRVDVELRLDDSD